MVQANLAFIQIYASLSLIVTQMEQITNFAASIERLSTFNDAVTPAPAHGIQTYETDRFALKDVTLLTPDRDRTLFQNLTMDLEGSNNLVVGGQSGVGKSSLLRAIAGLWTQGSGIVLRPALEEIFFLPQKPYMLLGSLRDQMLYPRMELEIPDDELRRVLESVNLADLPERSGGFKAKLIWADVLSWVSSNGWPLPACSSTIRIMPFWMKPPAHWTGKMKPCSTGNCRSWIFIISVSATEAASWIITTMCWSCRDRINGNC